MVEKRQEALKGYQRQKWSYNKRDSTFWVEGGKQDATKKVKRILTQPSICTETPTQPASREQTHHTAHFTKENLMKRKVPELLVLLKDHTGIVMRAKSRKTAIVEALLGRAE